MRASFVAQVLLIGTPLVNAPKIISQTAYVTAHVPKCSQRLITGWLNIGYLWLHWVPLGGSRTPRAGSCSERCVRSPSAERRRRRRRHVVEREYGSGSGRVRRAASGSGDDVGGAPAACRAATRTSQVLSALLLTCMCSSDDVPWVPLTFRCSTCEKKKWCYMRDWRGRPFLKSIAFYYATGSSGIITS